MQLTRLLTGGLPLLGLFAHTSFALTSDEVVKGIDDITDQSQDLQDPVSNLKPFNIITNAPKVIDGLKNIVADLNEDIIKWKIPDSFQPKVHQPYRTADDGGPPFTDSKEAQAICDSFRTFVNVHQQLLAIIIGKRSIFSNTPVLAPMTAVLRSLESVVDTTAFTVIDLVPPCSGDVSDDRNRIDKSLADAVKTYSMPAIPGEKLGKLEKPGRHGKSTMAPNGENIQINIELA